MEPNTYEYLNDAAKAIVGKSDDVRIDYILNAQFIRYQRIGKLLDEISFLLRRPPRTRPWGIAVEALPGQGKSMFAEAVRNEYPDEPATAQQPTTRPVVILNMSGAREARAIHTRIFEAIDAPIPDYMRIADQERLAIQLLVAANTKLLILDELQDVLRATRRQRELALQAIKYIMNIIPMPILALGSKPVMLAFREDSHMAARFRLTEFPKWKPNRDLAGLLKGFESRLPLRNPSHLYDPKMMRLIVKLTEGIMGPLADTVMYAATFAVLDGSEQITGELLERGATELPTRAYVSRVKRETRSRS